MNSEKRREGGACAYCGAVEGKDLGVAVNDELCDNISSCFQRAGEDARRQLLNIEETALDYNYLTSSDIEEMRSSGRQTT